MAGQCLLTVATAFVTAEKIFESSPGPPGPRHNNNF